MNAAPATPDTIHFRRQIDESRELRGRREVADLLRQVNAFNDEQGMLCAGIRMDPYNPCNGSCGNLCMQCPRRKTLAIVPSPIPG